MTGRSERLARLLFENRNRFHQQRLWDFLHTLQLRSVAPLDTRWVMDFGQWPGSGAPPRQRLLDLDTLTLEQLSVLASKYLSNGLVWRVVLFLPEPNYRLGFQICEPVSPEIVEALCNFPVEYFRCVAGDETMSLEWDVDERGAWEFRVSSRNP